MARGLPRTAVMGQRFMQQAERDLEAAQLSLHPRLYYVAANLAHQAAEKALKAAHWHLRAEEPRWSHDLGELAEGLTQTAGGIPAGVDRAIDLLEPLLELVRYPSGDAGEPIPAESVGDQQAASAVDAAAEVLAWVRGLLQQPPGRPQRGSR
jgi:HEPN domain-containing protein